MAVRYVDFTIKAANAKFTASDIISADIKRGITDGSFGIGFTQSDRLTFQVVSSEKIAKKTRCDVTAQIGEKSGEPGEPLSIGRFYADECTRDGSVITVTAYDLMYWQTNIPVKFTGVAKYSLPALSFPCSMQAVLDYICAYRKITCEFTCQNYTISEKPMKSETDYYTVREIIGFIAGCHGCNAKFDDEGTLRFVPFSENNEVQLTAADVIDMTIDDSEPFRVNALLFERGDGTSIYIKDGTEAEYDPDDEGVIKTFNPFATVEIAENVWAPKDGSQGLGGLSYYGGSITRRGDTLIQCGDVLPVGNLKYPGDSSRYSLCVTDISYTFSASEGFMETVSSQADKTDNYPVGGSSGGGAVYYHGVGEWLDDGHTAEIFNCYKDTDYLERNSTNARYDHIEGAGNKSTFDGDDFNYDGYNHVEGNNNKLRNCYDTHVGGYANEVGKSTDWNDNNFVYGYRNICDDIARVFVSGYSNQISNVDDSTVFGEHNTLSGDADGMLISGGDNTVTGGMYTTVLGNYNTVENVNHSLVVGQSIRVTNQANGSIICGNNYTMTNVGSNVLFVAGHDNYRFIITDNNGVTTTGAVTAAQFSGAGADYAEYFEWADGNSSGEDRCGMLVMLYGDKIVPAHRDNILGAVSARASVVGNAYEEYWHGKYITDVYGRSNGEISPDFGPDKTYIPRSQRSEWDVVGLIGRLIIRDDGSCKVGEFVSARRGIGTSCYYNTGVRVLKRIDETHIEVLIK